MSFIETSAGLVAESEFAQIVFFKKNPTLNTIQSLFAQKTFHRLHQTHSDLSVVASPSTAVSDPTRGFSSTIGDSLVSVISDSNQALGVSTADCLPVIVVSSTTIAAIHAGWKGIENEIILKTLRTHFAQDENIAAFIGPHIQWDSFEVDTGLAEKFRQQHQRYIAIDVKLNDFGAVLKASPIHPHKAHINLAVIAKCQLILGGVSAPQILLSSVDTKTNTDWASFRREGANMGKNLGFVARRPS